MWLTHKSERGSWHANQCLESELKEFVTELTVHPLPLVSAVSAVKRKHKHT